MQELFDQVSAKCSIFITRSYSTSFSLGILLLAERIRKPIYSIYGFVRLADEIVDSFHNHDKKQLLEELKRETFLAIERGISTNPVIHSFQKTVNEYTIDRHLIETFLKSMEMDLDKKEYNEEGFKNYIMGSAEVVGLMCLQIFCRGDERAFAALKHPAMKLGAAFQKVNFLRDVKYDHEILGRSYFPKINFSRLSSWSKRKIEAEIRNDFQEALAGIKQLPRECRLGVYVAYMYYLQLFKKIRSCPPERIFAERLRVANREKLRLLLKSYLIYNLRML